jgi:hypothetical protein
MYNTYYCIHIYSFMAEINEYLFMAEIEIHNK